MTAGTPICPHCQSSMKRWQNPPMGSWVGEFQYVCFNDDCPYFVRGWAWMEHQFGAHSSYRFRMDPATGETGPLPVWSKDALRSSILDDEAP
ncbi:MAG: ogr/Delta-like zinc finger family protein [Acidobacteriota bacterium]